MINSTPAGPQGSVSAPRTADAPAATPAPIRARFVVDRVTLHAHRDPVITIKPIRAPRESEFWSDEQWDEWTAENAAFVAVTGSLRAASNGVDGIELEVVLKPGVAAPAPGDELVVMIVQAPR